MLLTSLEFIMKFKGGKVNRESAMVLHHNNKKDSLLDEIKSTKNLPYIECKNKLVSSEKINLKLYILKNILLLPQYLSLIISTQYHKQLSPNFVCYINILL